LIGDYMERTLSRNLWLCCLIGVSLLLTTSVSLRAADITITTSVGSQTVPADESIEVTGTGTVNGFFTGINGISNNTATVDAGGLVSGGLRGLRFNNGGTVDNSGTIRGTGFGSTGVVINGDVGTVNNYMGGVIRGFQTGVSLGAGGLIDNSG